MKSEYAAFSALGPFFELIRGCLSAHHGDHYFDTIAENAVFEFRYDFRGWPRRIEGRDSLMARAGYGKNILLNRADALVVHRCDDGRIVVVEYDVHGRVVASGAAYENRFVSILALENRKIAHWRDYMDSLSAMRALSAQT